MTELIKYNAACAAIARAYKVDEVKHIRDRHLAIAAYAKQLTIERPLGIHSVSVTACSNSSSGTSPAFATRTIGGE